MTYGVIYDTYHAVKFLPELNSLEISMALQRFYNICKAGPK